MKSNSHMTKAVLALMAFSVFALGCTKTRDASLPETEEESIFSISDFGDLQTENSQYKILTDSETSELALGESSKATAEKGMVAISKAEVPSKISFMFKGLEIPAAAGKSYPITFSVDKEFVTSYKVINDVRELSALERELSQVKEEVVLQKQIQREQDSKKIRELVGKLNTVRQKKAQNLVKNNQILLVPLFKYKVEAYGILQKNKNEYREETSTLRLKASDWTTATHIKIATHSSARLDIGIDPSSKGDLDRTFVMNKINNKVMTAGVLRDEFQLPVNLDDNKKILTLLDVSELHIYEIGSSKTLGLTDSQREQLKMNNAASDVRQCPVDVAAALPEAQRADCVLVLRFDIPVSYVKPELPAIDNMGNQSAIIKFTPVRASDSVGLVQIERNAEPKTVVFNNRMDPRYTVKISDIKGKEFFFKRTLEDAPVTAPLAPGMAGQLTIVKFELEENRLVIRKADKLVNFKSGSNDTDFEELMSLPINYFKTAAKNASGADYSSNRLEPASRQDAEYFIIDWTFNTLRTNYSPYESMHESCIGSVGDMQVSDLDMKLSNGVLNFSLNYSVGLRGQCISDYTVTNDYNGNPNYQVSARLKERISFKLNDGQTDKSFAPEVPFRVQNQLGYGVWTIGQLNPTKEGLLYREGQEQHKSVVHDFRNGKKLVYTVTGLEPSVSLDPEIRALYKETVTDVVKSWDFAYHQAFKGTSLERSGNYLEIQFSGENGISAKVGDLDKNIVHFENKFNDNHGILGVSQVGFNPRSGIVVADSLIIYAGNLQKYVAGSIRNKELINKWNTQKDQLKKAAVAAANQGSVAQAPPATAGLEQQKDAALQIAKNLNSISKGHQLDLNTRIAPSQVRVSSDKVRQAWKELQSVGFEKFKYASPESEMGWIDRSIRKLYENPNLDQTELAGVIAEEVMKSKGNRMADQQRIDLNRTVQRGRIRTQLKAAMKNSPGCFLATRDQLETGFVQKGFKEALRGALYFDIGHEMGHSQGLTHNFIASTDKANFKNEDGSESKRNYSSVMDYFEPALFNWDGIGSYDIHALRASHTGLLEVSQTGLQAMNADNNLKSKVVSGKFVNISTIKSLVASNGWNNFQKVQVDSALRSNGAVKEYKYCTDIHVGYEPTCQRFDFGTNPQEIVQNIIKDYQNHYVVAYHGWDRNQFGWSSYGGALGGSFSMMFQMRQFMDEMFYMLIEGKGTQEERQSYIQAALEGYLFYNQILRTPTTELSFENPGRFALTTYQVTDANNNQKAAADFTEMKSPLNIITDQYRLDTIGFDQDRVMALNMLTMKGYPALKYYERSYSFSYLDFEKYLLGMESGNSLFIGLLREVFLDTLSPTVSNQDGKLIDVDLAKVDVTPTFRAYAGIYGLLNLEASTLRDKDNFANYFKVGSSVGATRTDRPSVVNLGVNTSSEAKVSYWALDNAIVTQGLIKVAVPMANFLSLEDTIKPLIIKLAAAQIANLSAGGRSADSVEKAKAELLNKLTALNEKGDLISHDIERSNPNLSLKSQVDLVTEYTQNSLIYTLKLASGGVTEADVKSLKEDSKVLAEAFPLLALNQLAVKEYFSGIVKAAGDKPVFGVSGDKIETAVQSLMNGSELEFKYGILVKNFEFLNKLTNMTNPEYAR